MAFGMSSRPRPVLIVDDDIETLAIERQLLAESGFRVVEVWESQAANDKFVEEKLGQALQKANINVKPEFAEVYNIIKP